MQIITQSRRVWIYGVLGALVLAYLATDVVLPYMEDIGNLHDEVARKREVLARYKGRLAAKDVYVARLEERKRQLESFNSRFLDAVEPSQGSAKLLEILNGLAGEAGLEPTRREFRNPKRLNPDYQKISAKIDATCNPEQLVLFLAALRNQSKYIVIDEISIRSSNVRNNFRLMPSLQVSAIMRHPESKEGKQQKPNRVAAFHR